jgi:hypothetical protein
MSSVKYVLEAIDFILEKCRNHLQMLFGRPIRTKIHQNSSVQIHCVSTESPFGYRLKVIGSE